MARRSLKGYVASCSTGFLRILNVIVALCAIPLIVITFVLRPSPTVAGWGFVLLGVICIISGLFGTCAVNQQGCCSCFHLFFVLLSIVGLAPAFIITLVNPTKILDALSPVVSDPNPMDLVKANAIVCFALFCFQLLVLLVGCLINVCGLTDYYEDLEAQTSEKELARQAREDERRRQKIEATSAHQLAAKMKEKYGVETDTN